MKKRNCIFTCFIPMGRYSTKSFEVHVNNLKRYCKKYDLDYFILDRLILEYNFNTPGQLHYKYAYYRFYIHELLKQYERVLYIDFDMLFFLNCENIFDLVPSNKIGYVPMMDLESNDINSVILKTNCNMYNKIYNTDISSLCISGGFHLFPNIYVDLLSISKLLLKKSSIFQPNNLFDVKYMDYLTSKYSLNAFLLPIEYNFLYPHKLFPNDYKFNKLREYSLSGNIKIIHIVALSPLNLSIIRYNHMRYFDEKFGVK